MRNGEKVNILLVDDRPAKLSNTETILSDIGENLICASSAQQALDHLRRTEIAVVVVDVCMPGSNGFELAAMIRDHPRLRKTAIIFASAIHAADLDRLRGHENGHETASVDYVAVPVIPEVLRAKVKIFAELYRKSRQLEELNAELERRVAERTAELERSNRRLQESEDRRNLALAAGKMGSWDWDLVRGICVWDEGQRQIFGADPAGFEVMLAKVRELIDRNDWKMLCRALKRARRDGGSHQLEFRVRRPDGGVRWCLGTAAASKDAAGRIARIRGVTMDITERKEAEDRQSLLAREVDHRTKNALAVVHAIISLTRAEDIKQYSAAVEGRIQALARAHCLLSDSRWLGARMADLIQGELAPYRAANLERVGISGNNLWLHPSAAQALALTVHELATNAAKYGALSVPSGSVQVTWESHDDRLELRWIERGGPPSSLKAEGGFGTRVIKASVETQLCGSVEFDWRHDGLQCAIRVPCRPKAESFDNFWDAIPDLGAPHSDPQHSDSFHPDPLELGPHRQLPLVKDEGIISMMMNQTLGDSTATVAGT